MSGFELDRVKDVANKALTGFGDDRKDIAAQIAGNPDAAPVSTDERLENARRVIRLKGRRAA